MQFYGINHFSITHCPNNGKILFCRCLGKTAPEKITLMKQLIKTNPLMRLRSLDGIVISKQGRLSAELAIKLGSEEKYYEW